MEMTRLLEDYGCLTFSDDVMKERIPKSIYKEFHASLDKGEELLKIVKKEEQDQINICESIDNFRKKAVWEGIEQGMCLTILKQFSRTFDRNIYDEYNDLLT